MCAATAMTVWALIDMPIKKHLDLEGCLYAAVCGLVMITPCAGYVTPGYSVVIAIYGTAICYGVLWLWMRFAHLRYIDDSLFVWCSHGCGGIIGAFSVGLFATTSVNSAGADGAFYGRPIQLGYQMIGILVCTDASRLSLILISFLKVSPSL